MSEILALTRLAISKSRRAVLFLTLVAFAGIVIGASVDFVLNAGAEKRQPYAVVFFMWSILPAAFATFVLFDFSSDMSLDRSESNFNSWVLRSPIRTWKISLVPIVLKTCWVIFWWFIFTDLVARLEDERLPIWFPMVTMASIAIWSTAFTSRPFRYGWLRLVGIGAAVLIAFGTMIGYFSVDHMKAVQWRPIVWFASQAITIVSFVASIGMTVRWIELARTSPGGTSGGVPGRIMKWFLWEAGDRSLRHRSPVQSLVWFDMMRTRDRLWQVIVIGVVPALLIGIAFVPLHAVSVVMAIVLFATFAAAAVAGNVATGTTNYAVLSPLLHRSPIDNATIAWSRFLTMMAMALGVYSLVGVVFAGWSLRSFNRLTWMQWATDTATRLDMPDQSVSVGVRVSIMIVLTATIVMSGLTAGFWWASVSGRDWIAIAAATVGVTVMMSSLIAFALWFAQQTDWESTQVSLRAIAAWIPPILVTLMVSKAVAAAWVATALVRSSTASLSAVVKVAAIWGLIAIGSGAVLNGLNPTSFLSMLHCFALPILVTPLAGVLILPIAVGWDRHR